jgi:hypothetical protein
MSDSVLNDKLKPPKLPYEIVPLIYNNDIDVTNINNILLIDDTVHDNNIFVDSCNTHTFPIIYNHCSSRTELRELLLNKFSLTQLSRIAFVFHNSNMDSKKFLDNDKFFELYDINDNLIVSENVQFLIDLIKEFNIKNIDYLACNSLQIDDWNRYYDILQTNTNVIIGASNDETGNIKYGGDWLMENTLEDVKNTYFNGNIENYTSTLATIISISCDLLTNNNIYIKQLTNGKVYYSMTNNADDDILTGVWTHISIVTDWQVYLYNGNSVRDETNRLIVTFLTNITLNHVDNRFIIYTSFVTLNGNNKTFYINNVINWTGLISSGNITGGGVTTNITIQNFITNSSITTTLAIYGGFLICSNRFQSCTSGTNIIENCVNNCDIKQSNSAGGISGFSVFNGCNNLTTCIIRNCINNGNNIGYRSGGICGMYTCYNTATNIITDCINNGTLIGNESGGITGYDSFRINNNNTTVSNCVNNGSLAGVFGSAAGIGCYIETCNIINCYSIGNTRSRSGGIIFSVYPGSIIKITNCYSLYGNITNGMNLSLVTITKCYAPLGNWSTIDAYNNLLFTSDIWGYQKIKGITDTSLPFVLLSLNSNYSVFICFNKDTKILTNTGYRPVQDLRKGDLIKTLLHGFVPINMIGYSEIHNPRGNERIKDRLYIYSQSEYSEITEDLIITGRHSILVDEFREGEKDKTVEVLGEIFKTDYKYRLPAYADTISRPYDKEGSHTIYHIALENDDYYMNYGIYANGLLVETCSRNYLRDISRMKLIE